ncbi:hypothetical protein [uncultured Sphingomonas sp.]|uniref:hypothetical protein n=1 Tax=uncultured Sphingomonas sp. TaxID=158754 RepID=UPI00261FACE8|nr:hypothetical protein [uncultured Sphingomonas sp.]
MAFILFGAIHTNWSVYGQAWRGGADFAAFAGAVSTIDQARRGLGFRVRQSRRGMGLWV